MKFSFKAVKNDVVVQKTIEATTEGEVLNFLRKNNYVPISISQNKPIFSQFNAIFDKVTFSDIVEFTRQLAIMLNAGLTLVDCFAILEKQMTKDGMIQIIQNIQKEVLTGNPFSKALQKYPQHFSNLYIALVKSGEASGKMSDILLKLADNLEKEREFQGKVKGALTYPVVVFVAMGAIMFLMITFVIPKLLNLYKDFNIDLPISTKILMFVSGFLAQFWPLVLIGGFFISGAINRYIKTPQGKLLLDTILLKMPIFGKIVSISSLVDSTRTLSILIGAGVSILDTLMIIVETTGNAVYRNAFAHIVKEVERGVSLGNAFNNEDIFPPILVQMVSVGEQTGNLDDTMMRISHYFDLESELAIKTVTTLIEPLILVILGLGVGFLVVSVITPIYNLTTSFK
ncbi:MAG: type II secretion system F family protein [Candidatus Roizmanbacteria bacterium]|nr:type II secretion system F family protein [Candidatus Roizmanbacteria bacterium]